MKHLMRRTAVATVVTTAALVGTFALATPAQADPAACDDAVSETLHTAHELAGPAGEPVHAVEDVYCDIAP